MAQNYVSARLAVAGDTASAVQTIVAGMTRLEQAAANAAALAAIDPTAGTFLDSDFAAAPGLGHYSAALMGELLGVVLTGLQQVRDTHLNPSDPSTPTMGAILRYAQRGNV